MEGRLDQDEGEVEGKDHDGVLPLRRTTTLACDYPFRHPTSEKFRQIRSNRRWTMYLFGDLGRSVSRTQPRQRSPSYFVGDRSNKVRCRSVGGDTGDLRSHGRVSRDTPRELPEKDRNSVDGGRTLHVTDLTPSRVPLSYLYVLWQWVVGRRR